MISAKVDATVLCVPSQIQIQERFSLLIMAGIEIKLKGSCSRI